MPTDSTDARKIDRGPESAGCPVGRNADGTWLVNDYAAARATLRSPDTVQAGLGVETLDNLPASIRRPVLYRDGPEHREHRRQTARFFTPRRVDESYRGFIDSLADRQLAVLRDSRSADLADLGFGLAIDVACTVIGLTESRPGLTRRLERFFPDEFGSPGFTTVNGLYWVLRQARNWTSVFLSDVRPAVRARRARRRDDLISHLLDEGCSSVEILGECITFAAAGMVTTREFITLAAWHLFTDRALCDRYRVAAEPERFAILHEILRLEPVVANLLRRTTAPVELPGGDGESVTVGPGELIEIHIAATNIDQAAVGDDPLMVCPARSRTDATAPALSFGDGAHKCPGATIAIVETDIFLGKLLALPGVRMHSPPRVGFNDAIGGYTLRGMIVGVDDPGQ
ncbi:cytochrome P450 [Nocardia sp. NPDC024068]|uniref:cytochrome P450 n=1 Tax=Nocardia sp. NPDC024068 TaxID=3157197 RepID=UPI00340ADE5D